MAQQYPVIERRSLTCYLCGSHVGHVDTLPTVPAFRRLTRHDGARESLAGSRLPRCCFCGGSVYLDEAEQIVVWPKVKFGHEKPGRKPRHVREMLAREAAQLDHAL